jgi:hypothetical protein
VPTKDVYHDSVKRALEKDGWRITRDPYPLSEVIFDANKNRYFLLTMAWMGDRRIHHVSVDVEIRGDKFWIHYDGTEDGIATDLERAGIPKNRIVLAWHPEEVRHFTEYAVK